MLDRFAAFLDSHAKILLTTHENPDGDGVGAAVALAAYLKEQGTEVPLEICHRLIKNRNNGHQNAP